jgi:glycosyltransferase involved in cell wall biosynthesis
VSSPEKTSKPDYVVSVCAVLQDDGTGVEPFLREVSTLLDEKYRYHEIVLIDNQSLDGSSQAISKLLTVISDVRLVRLSKRCTREIALAAALDHCIGDYLVLMDYRTDPIDVIPRIVDLVVAGNDVVAGRAPERRGSWVRSILSRSARRFASIVLRTRVEQDAGYLYGLSRRAVNSLTRIHSKSRYILYDTSLVGFKRLTFPYEHKPNTLRESREPLTVFLRSRLDMVVGHSAMPLRLASLLGLFASGLNLLYLGYILVVVLVKRNVVEGWLTTSITQTVMFLLLFFVLTIVAEYIGRILQESKDQPLYFIENEQHSTISSYDKDRLNVL